MLSTKFSFNAGDFKQWVIYAIGMFATWFVTNQAGVTDYLIRNYSFDPEIVGVCMALVVVFAKKFIQQKK